MKTPTTTLFFIVFAASVVRPENISPGDIDPQKLCGDLEVMKMDANQLPSGISLDNVRMCKEHPLTQDDIDILDGAHLAPADVSQSSGTSALPLYFGIKRACYYAAPYGCTRGYCWKACDDDGKWCWTASQGGYGAWATCKTFEDCGLDDDDFGCGKRCQRCGCGC
ncbi:hypothetical protein J3E68DRAFT_420882 [Trichoderma sp. SZMC 28012]